MKCGSSLWPKGGVMECCQWHCSQRGCHAWSRCHARHWAVSAAACQQSCPYLFISHLSTETGLSTCWIARLGQAYVSVRVEQAWLLQRHVSQPSKVNCCSAATCTECGCKTCCTSGATRSRDVCSTASWRSTLASAFMANHVQAVSSDASCQHQTCSIILDGVCHSNSWPQFHVTSPLCEQLSLWEAETYVNGLSRSP